MRDSWLRFLDAAQAAEYVGGPTVLKALKAQRLVKPRIQQKRLTRFDRMDLDAACSAFKSLKPLEA